MKRGFTLIELLGVIIIIALLTLLVLPNVINLTNSSNKKNDKLTENIILNAAKLYVSEINIENSNKKGSNFCVSLNDLVEKGYLQTPIKLSDKSDITYIKSVQVNYKDNYEYTIVDNEDCVFNIDSAVYLLSKGYQEVQYIGSTGTQYIDIGIKRKPNLSAILKLKINDNVSTDTTFIGAGDNTSGDSYNTIIGMYSSHFSMVNQGTVLTNSGDELELNTTYDIEGSWGNNKTILAVNGIEIYNTSASKSFSSNYNMFLFARNNSGSPSHLSSIKLYSCKIKDNNILVRDFIPCYRKSDNEIGLYDLVEDKFYTNLGTDNFSKGVSVSTDVHQITQ